MSDDEVTIGELSVHRGKWQVYRGKVHVEMTKQSFDLLMVLAQDWPNTVSQQDIISKVWADRVVSEQSVKQAIKRLRESLEDLGDTYIVAVRGRGYRLRCNNVEFSPTSNKIKAVSIASASGLVLLIIAYVLSSSMFQPLQNKDLATSNNTYTTSPDALQLYMSGLDYYQRYRIEDAEIAITQFKKAITLDESFAKAYAGLSDAQSLIGDLDQAIMTAQHAISLDKNESTAYKALGHAYSLKGWFQKAINSYQQALELDPSNLAAISNTGFHMKELGRLDEALSWNLKALRLNPKNAIVYLHIAETLNSLNLPEHALKWYEKAKSIRPDYYQLYHSLTYFYIASGHIEEAKKTITQGLAVSPNNSEIIAAAGDLAIISKEYSEALRLFDSIHQPNEDLKTSHYAAIRIGQIYWLQDNKEQALLILEQALVRTKILLDNGDEWPGNYVDIATIFAIKHEYNESFVWLNRAFDKGWVNYKRLSYDPVFTAMNHLPEFAKLVNKIQLKVKAMEQQAPKIEE